MVASVTYARIVRTRVMALREAIHEKVAGLIDIPAADAGIQTPTWLAGGLKADRIAEAAAARRVEAIPTDSQRTTQERFAKPSEDWRRQSSSADTQKDLRLGLASTPSER